MALLNQIPTASPYQAGSTGYTPTSTSAEKATATGYTPTTATADKAESTGYTPDAFKVTPEQTVEGRLGGLIAADSPLMQQARTRALQYANSRGLINSSMAAGEAQARMVESALPIAQQDASQFNQAMTNTVNAKNTASQFGAAAKNTASLTNAQLGTNVNLANQNAHNAAAGFKASADNTASLTNAQLGTNVNLANQDANNTAAQFGANASNTAALTNAQLGTNVNLANLDTQTRLALSEMDNSYRQLLQTNQDAASAFNQVAQNIANISQNSTMTQEAKDAAIQSQLNSLNELLQQQAHVASTAPGSVGSLNLGSYFSGGLDGGSGGAGTGTGSTGGTGETPAPPAPGTYTPPGGTPQPYTGVVPIGGSEWGANPQFPGEQTRQVPVGPVGVAWMPYDGQQQYLTEVQGKGFPVNGRYYPTVEAAFAAMEQAYMAANPSQYVG